MKELKIGLIGLGTVGRGVFKTLKDFDNIKIKKIAVRNKNKKRDIEGLDENLLTTDAFEIVNDPEIQAVVEVAGGIDPAYDLIKTAILNKKHIITANKELVAKHGPELFKLANENNVVILYEAAVAGGIPIIMPIKTTLAANKVSKLAGILNGTTNYILTKMEEDGISYEKALSDAQKLGYAEADPSGDVEGFDTMYKVCALASIVFHKRIDVNKIYREGISKISAKDIKNADELGYKIKLIALAQKTKHGDVDVRVHPMLVPKNKMIAKINNVLNAVMIEGHPVGQVVFTGPGAGEFPTASSVVGDILALSNEIDAPCPLPMMRCKHSENANQTDIADTENKYYISVDAQNTPGVIGMIGTVCGNHKINLFSILQKEINEDESAEIIVITGVCKESNLQSALKELKEHSQVNNINSMIRVME